MTKKKVVKKTTTTTVVTEEVVANKTQIVCILDASSSMNSIIDEARDGFNKFIDDQKKLGDEASLTVATFNSSHDENNGYDLLYDNVPIENVEHLTVNEWNGGGMTALYDAIGKAITDVSNAHKKLKKADRPNKVLVAIVTDGHENASKEFTQSSIKKLIGNQEKQDWQFVYLAADQDASMAASTIGVSTGNSLRYANSGLGNTVVFDTLSTATSNYRGMDMKSASFTSDSASLMSTLTNGTGEVGEDLINDKKDK